MGRDLLRSLGSGPRQSAPLAAADHRPRGRRRVYVFTTNDGYDSSRWILLDLIRQFQVKGDYIAMAPGREMLIVAGSEDKSGLEAMVALGREGIAAAADGFGNRRFGWTATSGCRGCRPCRSTRSYEISACLRGADAEDYAVVCATTSRTKGIAGKPFTRKTNEDVFVAAFSVMQHKKKGAARNFLHVGRGRPVCCRREWSDRHWQRRPKSLWYRWEKVVEVAGHLMTPMDIYPERYRVKEFPPAEQLAAMGNELS